MINTVEQPTIAGHPDLTPYEKLVGLALVGYLSDDGCLLVTRTELADLLQVSERTVQKSLAKMEYLHLIKTTRNSQGHLEKIAFLAGSIRENGGRTEGESRENRGRIEGESRENGGRHPSLPETPDMNKSSTAVLNYQTTLPNYQILHYQQEEKPVLASSTTGSEEKAPRETPAPESAQVVPPVKTGWARIQELWALLTRDAYNMAWCQSMCNRYGILKLVDAMERAYCSGVHQDTLKDDLKKYLAAICINRNPDPKPTAAAPTTLSPRPNRPLTKWEIQQAVQDEWVRKHFGGPKKEVAYAS